ncbi:glycosyl transferase family 2 [Parabacteroides distasonis]|uniref:Glycosyl transferase family 2 n=1 Tax=Parabacteroides distasonis TaxID=823 RepID=A0A9Q4MNW5_PARDI|nr:glycosyl transferase family 2 [Parabacteroides sp. CT06]MBT9682813.1 glycosyl transferase family 2 [Parabacteroides distasonis]MBV4247748.1 glycosyl transferase family 2 [Parabacteroides distasonis]MBV4266543.1 glycosyl transferase family 2 [Parabacteroides distasonis]MBV4386195.1 glycosyl transferase family 2 [Parabacteroides distasonis]
MVDVFGGPDKAYVSFFPIQKAINYAMTSSLTTGGISSGKKKLVHCLPALFTFSVCLLVIGSFFCRLFLVPLIIYALLLFVDAMFRNKCDLRVGSLSVIASFTQLFGYGTGFLRSII